MHSQTAFAKSSATDDGTLTLLPLFDHAIDVAAVAETLLKMPTINGRLSALAGRRLSHVDAERIAFLIGLHDSGKVVHGFQRRLRGESGQSGHIAPVWAALYGISRNRPLAETIRKAMGRELWSGWFSAYTSEEEDVEESPAQVEQRFWEAILAHHGSLPLDANQPDRTQWQPNGNYDPLAALRETVSQLQAMFACAFDPGKPLPGSPRFVHALTGFITLADWLGSDQNVFRFPVDGAPSGTERAAWARSKAAELMHRRGMDPAQTRLNATDRSADFHSLFPTLVDGPRPAQKALLEMALPAPGQIVTLEAETGSGKTEAALVHFFRLFQAGEVDGLYFALPTRAAAVQIHRRVNTILHDWFSDSAPGVGLAVPGYLRVDDQDGQSLPDRFGVLWPDAFDRDRAWAAERAKSYLSGWVMVGTIDQVLLGGLRVRHAQFRSGPMLRLLLVVDEVHASDTYMRATLGNVLTQHRSAGGHSLLMSATLGGLARQELLVPGEHVKRGQRLDLPAAIACPYPAVQRTGEPIRAIPHNGQAKHVAVELSDPEALTGLLRRVADAARVGAAVLVIRNTVDGAREAFQALEAMDAPLLRCNDTATPHHSRYAPEDRKWLDEALEAAFTSTKREGVVAVCTQTAEQSLDICADWLVTDLCPGDVLLQRIGRLHRHTGRTRPQGFETASVCVIAPAADRLAAVINPSNGEVQGRAPLGLGRVYRDMLSAVATRNWLEEQGEIHVPQDNRSLIETVTHKANLEAEATALGGPWHSHWTYVQGANLGEGMTAASVRLIWTESVLENQPQDERKVMTRLGLDDRRLDLPASQPGPFGRPVSGFTVPGWMVKGLGEEAVPEDVIAADGKLRFRLGETTFCYDRLGLRRESD